MRTYEEEKVEVASSKSTGRPKSLRRKRKHHKLADAELGGRVLGRGLETPTNVSTKVSRKLEDRSRFLALPAELRDMIYHFALTLFFREPEGEYQVDMEKFVWRSPPDPEKVLIEGSKPILLPALTRVSSQVRRESLAVFFGRNNFRFISWRNLDELQLISNGQKFSRYGYHMLNIPSGLRLAHPSWSAHADLVRTVILEMQISLAERRMVEGHEYDNVRHFFPMDVTFRRDVNATPQYSVSASLAPESSRTKEMWPPSLGDHSQDQMREEEEAVAAYLGSLAQSIIDNTQDSFTFSEQSLLAFMDRIPLTLIWHGSELTHDIKWTQLRYSKRLQSLQSNHIQRF